jgi:Uma2 family endonuclease
LAACYHDRMSAVPVRLMTSDEFIDWAMRQPSGRYELVAGRVVAMAPERTRHNLAKAQVWKALSEAVKSAGLPCTVFTDGMTVVIDKCHSREPDVAIQCGHKNHPDAVVLDAPMIVGEVVSPSSERDDTGAKLVEYFSVPSIRHYLIVSPEKRVVVHHEREGADIRTHILGEDAVELRFDPPGFAVSLSALLRGD